MVSEEFMKANKYSMEIAEKIERFLNGMGKVSLIPIINSLSICIKLPKAYRQRNSTLFVAPRGCGKSTLIYDILAKSNPRYFQVLDSKIFESQLVKKPREYFQNRILVHDDLITGFKGLSNKQREQLINFFTQLLNGGRYTREGFELKDIKCVAMFGIAKEAYSDHRKELFDSTMLDRFAIYELSVSRDKKMKILEFRDENREKNIRVPDLKLPFSRKEKEVKLVASKDMQKRVRELAQELDDYNIMSFARAQEFVNMFLMSNTLLNNRKETCEYDLQLYEILHPYHLKACGELKNEDIIRKLRLQNPEISVKDIKEKTGILEKTIYRILKRLKERGELG